MICTDFLYIKWYTLQSLTCTVFWPRQRKNCVWFVEHKFIMTCFYFLLFIEMRYTVRKDSFDKVSDIFCYFKTYLTFISPSYHGFILILPIREKILRQVHYKIIFSIFHLCTIPLSESLMPTWTTLSDVYLITWSPRRPLSIFDLAYLSR